MEKEHYKKAVIVPMYNEKENIIPLCRALLSVDMDFVVILVICPSSDGTQEIANCLTQENKRLVMVISQKGGLSEAYWRGFKKALDLGVGQIITMDGDFSHNPQDLPRLFKKGKECDLVVGSRYVTGGRVVGWPWKRKAISRGACILNKLILGIKIKDSTSGFRCYSRALIEYLISRPFLTQGFTFLAEAVVRAERGNWKVSEISITFFNRIRGYSKFSLGHIKEHIVGVFRLRREL